MANRDHIEIRETPVSELSSEDVEKGVYTLEGSAGAEDYIVSTSTSWVSDLLLVRKSKGLAQGDHRDGYQLQG